MHPLTAKGEGGRHLLLGGWTAGMWETKQQTKHLTQYFKATRVGIFKWTSADESNKVDALYIFRDVTEAVKSLTVPRIPGFLVYFDLRYTYISIYVYIYVFMHIYVFMCIFTDSTLTNDNIKAWSKY